MKLKTVLLIITCLLLSSPKIKAQETQPEELEMIFANPAKQPYYIGGLDAFSGFFHRNFVMPSRFKGSGVSTVSFVVEKDGSLSNIKVINDLGYGTKKELLRVLKLSPKWKPGEMHGKPVRTSYRMPITLVNP